MHFFLKSIDVWKIVESGWIKLEDTTDELTVDQTSARLPIPSMLYIKCFHRQNLQEFQNVNLLNKHGKS
jgi:hypothetical protein